MFYYYTYAIFFATAKVTIYLAKKKIYQHLIQKITIHTFLCFYIADIVCNFALLKFTRHAIFNKFRHFHLFNNITLRINNMRNIPTNFLSF